MIRPPFRPPLTHRNDQPAAATTETAAPAPASPTAAPASKSCCGRPGCCGNRPGHDQNEHAQSTPGLNSGNGTHAAGKADQHGTNPGRA